MTREEIDSAVMSTANDRGMRYLYVRAALNDAGISNQRFAWSLDALRREGPGQRAVMCMWWNRITHELIIGVR